MFAVHSVSYISPFFAYFSTVPTGSIRVCTLFVGLFCFNWRDKAVYSLPSPHHHHWKCKFGSVGAFHMCVCVWYRAWCDCETFSIPNIFAGYCCRYRLYSMTLSMSFSTSSRHHRYRPLLTSDSKSRTIFSARFCFLLLLLLLFCHSAAATASGVCSCPRRPVKKISILVVCSTHSLSRRDRCVCECVICCAYSDNLSFSHTQSSSWPNAQRTHYSTHASSSSFFIFTIDWGHFRGRFLFYYQSFYGEFHFLHASTTQKYARDVRAGGGLHKVREPKNMIIY